MGAFGLVEGRVGLDCICRELVGERVLGSLSSSQSVDCLGKKGVATFADALGSW